MAVFKGINVVSIPVPDLDKARAFYAEVLGLGDPLYDLPDEGWIEFPVGESTANLALTLTRTDSAEDSLPRITVVFDVDDCREACETLRRRGVECDEPTVFPGFVVFSTFHDPFGNRLQMCSDASHIPEGNST